MNVISRQENTPSGNGAPRDGRILIAHTNPQQVEAIQRQISAGLGMEILTAGDGVTAMRLVREHRPRLVIADVDLPRLDGFQLCRLIGFDQDSDAGTPRVILMTASYIDVVAEQVARDVRAFAYVHASDKPESLLRVIRLALGEEQANPLEPHLVNTRGHVLYAAKDDAAHALLTGALQPRGWSVHFVADGEALWSCLDSRMILCLMIDEDLLHVGSGISLARIRNDYRKLSIVVLSASADEAQHVRWMEAGVDNIIHKPIDDLTARTACRHAKVKYNLRSVHEQLQEKIDRLRSVSDYLDMVIDYSQEAIFSCDMDGVVKIWNKGAERMYGYSAEDIVGKDVDDFLNPPDFKRRAGDVIRMLIQRGSFAESEVQRRKKNGDVFPVTATYSSLLNSQGEFIGFSVIERDVTPVKALEAERIKSARLRAITQTAVTANDHINTPLGVILGYSQFLKLKLAEINETDAAALDTIQEQVHKIKGIMNKLKLMSDPIVKNYSIDGVTMFDLSKSK